MIKLLLLLSFMGYAQAENLERVANTSLSLPSDEPVDAELRLENAFGAMVFDQPVCVRSLPEDTRAVFIVEKTGRIQRVDLSSNTKTVFLDVAAFARSQGWQLLTGGEQGLLSVAFHPDFNNNGFFYVFYSVNLPNPTTSNPGGFLRHQRVARFQANGQPGSYNETTSTDLSSHVSMITQVDQASNHNGGDMHFGPDGYLYISLGDEGGANNQFNNGGVIDNDFFAAILRIDVDNRDGNLAPNPHTNDQGSQTVSIGPGTYSIPADNPLIGVTSHLGRSVSPGEVRTEMWVTGLRNPWRMFYDEFEDHWYVADVGQGRQEEINIVTGGEDCGWSRREGLLDFPRVSSAPDPFTGPVHVYGRRDGQSISGGIVYRGDRLPELIGTYIYGDHSTGNIWALKNTKEGREAVLLTGLRGVAAFGADPRNGDLLCCSQTSNSIMRLVRSESAVAPPARLSDTGAFASLSSMKPNAGIYEYSVNHPFWSDHAQKRRWFSLPDVTAVMNYSAEGQWDFPTGQVWIKHFDLERVRGDSSTSRPLETRFLVRTDAGVYGLSYRWREDGSDADLVGASGAEEVLSVSVSGSEQQQTWVYPSRTDCQTCHTGESNFALAFNTRQLNLDGVLGADQIDALHCAGFLDVEPASSVSLEKLPALEDTGTSVEARVRAYLDVNCGMCHQGSVGDTPGNFDARWNTQTDLTGLINGMLEDNRGDSANRVLVPGDVAHSVLIARLTGDEPRMPPLATTEVDEAAIVLIRQWVSNELMSRESYEQWAQRTGAGARDADDDFDGASNLLEYLTSTDPADGEDRYEIELTTGRVDFLQPANRRVVIEESRDLTLWEVLESQGNQRSLPAVDENRQLDLPDDEQKLFLRARVEGL